MSRTFCTGCGTEVKPEAGLLIPLCTECQFKDVRPGKQPQWMVRRRGERPQGPYTREIVTDWINRELLVANDEVARPGSAWKALSVHEDWRAAFTLGDKAYQDRLISIREREESRQHGERRTRLRNAIALGLIGVFVALPYMATRYKLTRVPEPWLASIQETWTSARQKVTSTFVHATNQQEALKDVTANSVLPGEAVIEEIRARRPASTEPFSLHYLRGRSLLQYSRPTAREEAVQELENAVLLEPREPRILAALAEAYALLARTQPKRADAAAALITRADMLAPTRPEVLRAKAAIAILNQSFDTARQSAQSCVESDPDNLECMNLLAQALLSSDQKAEALDLFNKVLSKAPHIPRFQETACEAALQVQDLPLAQSAVNGFLASSPDVPAAHAMAARFYEAIGAWSDAYRSARKAGSMDLAEIDARITAGELALVLEGPQVAGMILFPLVEEPALATHPRGPETLVAGSIAARRLGDKARARALAQKALDARPEWPPAALALALTLRDDGDMVGAEKAMKAAMTDGMTPVEAGRFYVNQGRLYQEEGRDKAAMATYESAINANPHSALARFGLAEAYLRLANLTRAVEVVHDIAPIDFEQENTHSPFQLCPLQPWSLAPLAAAFEKAIQQDIRFKKALPGLHGIIAYAEGRMGESEALLRKAITEDEADDASRAFLVRILLRSQRWEEAGVAAQRLVSTQGNAGLYATWLGLSLAHKGAFKESESVFERAYQSVDSWPGPHRMRAEALFLAGRKEEGIVQARRAWELDPADSTTRALVLKHSTR